MNNKIPPPIVTLLLGLGIYFSRNLFSEFAYFQSDIISSLFLLLGLVSIIVPILSFIKQKTTINPMKPEKASSLIATGIFKYSRNPMYVGMLFILLSIAVKFNIFGGLIIIFIFIFYITKFQIIPEEIVMERLFKETFLQYKKKTRRWI